MKINAKRCARVLKLHSVAFILLFLHPPVAAQDSTRVTVIAPGLTHSLHTRSGPFLVNVLEVDLSIGQYQYEAYRPEGLVLTSLQAARKPAKSRRDPLGRMAGKHEKGVEILAAINADFFSFQTGWPLGNHVEYGEFVLGTISVRSHLAFDATMKPLIERLSFVGSVKSKGGKSLPVNGINYSERIR